MELRQLRYFIAIAEELNFCRAAERLNMSQPPLSRQIQSLEMELNVRLLDRGRDGVRLTRAGEVVLARAQKLVMDAEELSVVAQGLSIVRQDELRLGYCGSQTATILPTVLRRYYECYPEERIAMEELPHAQIVSKVRTGNLEAGITMRPSPVDGRGLRFEPIQRHQVGIICAHSSPFANQTTTLRPSSVAKSRLVVYRDSNYRRWAAKLLQVSASRLLIAQECDRSLSVVAAVESGRGVAVVGESIKAIAGDRVRFIPFESGDHFIEVGWLYRNGVLRESLKQTIAAGSAGISALPLATNISRLPTNLDSQRNGTAQFCSIPRPLPTPPQTYLA